MFVPYQYNLKFQKKILFCNLKLCNITPMSENPHHLDIKKLEPGIYAYWNLYTKATGENINDVANLSDNISFVTIQYTVNVGNTILYITSIEYRADLDRGGAVFLKGQLIFTYQNRAINIITTTRYYKIIYNTWLQVIDRL